MVPRIGASYLTKLVADQIMKPPTSEEDGVPAEEVVQSVPTGDLDGEMLEDDDGRVLGRYYRLPNVAVYVVSNRTGSREAELKRALDDADTQVFFRTEEGRLTGIIYVPVPDSQRLGIQATRADDV